MIPLHIIYLKFDLIFIEKCTKIVLSCTNFQVLEFMLPCESKNSYRYHVFADLIRKSTGVSGIKYFLIFIAPNYVEKLVN